MTSSQDECSDLSFSFTDPFFAQQNEMSETLQLFPEDTLLSNPLW